VRLAMWILFALFLTLASVSNGQEIVLKDGQRIQWASLADAGDSITVEDKTGVRTKIKKDQIARMSPVTEEKPVALTGATFSFKKKTKAFNLMATVNPKADTFVGSWTLSGGILSNTGDGSGARLMMTPPVNDEEYDLELVAERTDGNEYLGTVLVGGGRQFLFVIDSNKAAMSGIWLLDGQGADKAKGDAVKLGAFLPKKQPTVITFMVRKSGLVVKMGGRDFYALPIDDWKRLSLADYHNIPKEKALGFVVGPYSAFRIHRITMTIPQE